PAFQQLRCESISNAHDRRLSERTKPVSPPPESERSPGCDRASTRPTRQEITFTTHSQAPVCASVRPYPGPTRSQPTYSSTPVSRRPHGSRTVQQPRAAEFVGSARSDSHSEPLRPGETSMKKLFSLLFTVALLGVTAVPSGAVVLVDYVG